MTKLKGKSFASTGRLRNKRGFAEWIKREGGRLLPKLTDKLAYLVVGQKRGTGPTAHEKKAAKLNQQGAQIQVISEEQFYQLLAPTREEAVALLQSGTTGREYWQQLIQSRWRGYPIPLPDLDGVDLHGVDLHDVRLDKIRLDGADLRNANLSDVWDLSISNGQLDGAKLCDVYRIVKMNACSLRGADLSGMHGGSAQMDHSDFTGATMKEASQYGTNLQDSIFRNAQMQKATFFDCNAKGADFSSADLTESEFRKCKLNEAQFVCAILKESLLYESDFRSADLSGADLRNAHLDGADLRDAKIDGANFEGAFLGDAKLTGLDLKKAHGLEAATMTLSTKVGPRFKELSAVVKQSQSLSFNIKVECSGALGIVQLSVTTSNKGKSLSASVRERMDKESHRRYSCRAKTLSGILQEMAKRYGHGTLLVESLEADIRKGPIKQKELRPLVLAACFEIFGQTLPSEADQEAARKQFQEELLQLLRLGEKGVEQWNAYGLLHLQKAGNFQGVDFSGLDLTGIQLHDLDFTGGHFDGANLTKASAKVPHRAFGGTFKDASFQKADLSSIRLPNAHCRGANFSGAKLVHANLLKADLREANFQGANLTDARLVQADLCGANFTKAKLKNVSLHYCRYDEHTQFPKGFRIPPRAKMKWMGKQPQRLIRKPKTPATPIDFDTFMKRLPKHADASKLTKALKMLKVDRFQLFAEPKADSLVGVVKSQTDKDLVYSCRLTSEGAFSCCTQNLNVCGGLQGTICKHLLVLLVGLTKAGQLDPTLADQWISASRAQKPVLDKEVMSETFLRYKGAEAGEVDWRPTETIPEDYYAL